MRTGHRIVLLILLPLFGTLLCDAQTGRTQTDLSSLNWTIWLDKAAKWQNDELNAPPVKIEGLSVNLPTGGWNSLNKGEAKNVHLPATVEEYYWGENGSKFGVTGNYIGVSWFYTKVMIPPGLAGKHVVLHFESVRFRAEVFVNQKLAGYDLVNSTPFDIDISSFVISGKPNDIAVRITDPNGNFDWRDSQNFMWGNSRTQPTHGFGGITGKVGLVITDKT